MELLQLKCRVCGAVERLYLNDNSNTAFEFMEWSDFTDSVPNLYDRIWERSSSTPVVGEKRLVKVRFPFSYRLDDSFNVLFQPALTALDGWETAEDISASAIVTCRFHRVLSHDEHFAWIEVEAVRVLTLDKLALTCPVVTGKFDMSNTYTDIERLGNWTFCSWSAQGDVGEWELFYTDSSGSIRSVLFSKWDMCKSDITFYG